MEITAGCVVAVVIVLALILVVALWRASSSSGGREGFLSSDHANFKIIDRVNSLAADLNCVQRLSVRIHQDTEKVKLHGADGDPQSPNGRIISQLAGAGEAMKHTTIAVTALNDSLSRSPPTYASALRLYHNLGGSDRPIMASADYLDRTANEINQTLMRNEWHGGDRVPAAAQEACAGLKQMASCMRSLLHSTHYLGAALGVE